IGLIQTVFGVQSTFAPTFGGLQALDGIQNNAIQTFRFQLMSDKGLKTREGIKKRLLELSAEANAIKDHELGA
ncbi:hypothetical protein HMPREF0530_0361, partial [Lacticaseibacillus paracasei subsp. paracasei ATCC 25302 = DSM 5622 = JCM 8130]